MFRRTFATLALGTAALLAACSTTRVTGTWSDPAFTPRPLTSVMVVGVSKEQTARRLYEDQLVQLLAERGVRAVPSYASVPADAGAFADPQRLEAAARAAGVDAVLSSQVRGVDQQTTVVPGTVGMMPGPWGVGWGGFYGRAFYQPPMVTTWTTVRIESLLFDVKADRTVFAVTTDSDAGSGAQDRIIRELSQLVVDQLAAKGFLRAK